MDLRDRNVLVTGGAGSIGSALVDRLVQAEANVAVLDFNKQALDALVEKHPSVEVIRCDVTDPNMVESSITQLMNHWDHIHGVVNNAGMTSDQPIVSLFGGIKRHDPETFDRVIRGCLHSVFYVTSSVVERMVKKRTKGVIVNISSVAASGNAGQTAYSAAKAGVEAMTKTWAKELNPLGIRVCGLAPGFTETNITKAMNEKVYADWNKRIPLKRMAQPEEIADGIYFCLTNDYFNGRILPVDGGLIL